MNGYAGKILRIDLTDRTVKTISTSKYAEWVGGHGMGSAIFYDIVVKEKKVNLEEIDGFHPDNVCTIMTSPLSGTLAPAAPRIEVQGIGVESYPIGWFTRSNFGGRFAAMMKFAQWDGIVIEGAADEPVWIDIRDDDVQIRECSELSLWGKDVWETQQVIFEDIAGEGGYGDWIRPSGKKRGGQTTQRPAVLTIGISGENLNRSSCLIHETSNAAGSGGFAAVWGSKKLKAISVIGTGDLTIADPKALMEARLWSKKYSFNQKNPLAEYPNLPGEFWHSPGGVVFLALNQLDEGKRPKACVGCHSGCHVITESGLGTGATCAPSFIYAQYSGNMEDYVNRGKVANLLNEYGINAIACAKLTYLKSLYELGVLGPGKEIDTPVDLDFDNWGSYELIEKLLYLMAHREGEFGEAIADGMFFAAKKWGRMEEDLASGLLEYPYWGIVEHGYDPRNEMEWGYGSILGDRDINEHDFNALYWNPTVAFMEGHEPVLPAGEITKLYTDKMIPYEGDQLMLDYSPENMYSEHIAKLVAWHRHYTRFWKQSVLYCNFCYPDFYNHMVPDKKGMTPEAEPKFFNAVTGMNLTFEEGMELGRKIWNLDQAIWTLQGRHRDMVHFAEYVYKGTSVGFLDIPFFLLPGRENGEWKYMETIGRTLDKVKFDEWKTLYYNIEGWDAKSGYPTRSTLESLGLENVADELERRNRLGEEG
ncbi:MAG: aldehyde:ferredoxin oxidoreductase [Deltaproteobacteria bacterium]|nr:aldehyde:ferredoxin oxidoreductase [Deltaproteobacteria bacterium]